MRTASRRSGFTLVELLVVIVVIGILAALLVPAISSARNRVKVAQVRTEISQLESAVLAFKLKYGVEPPSRFVIYLNRAGWDSDLTSKSIARRIWPQFDFDMGATMDPTKLPPGFRFYPSNWTAPQKMNAGECLLFFLGGVLENGAPNGFSTNPLWPFSPDVKTRQPRMLEFDVSRIRDSDQNGIMEYFDPLRAGDVPYLYFSSYEGKGYRPAELCCGLTDFYRLPGTPSVQGQPCKPQSFQILSAGLDGLIGNGGEYDPQSPETSLANGRPSSGPNQGGYAERDNITNFVGGRLAP